MTQMVQAGLQVLRHGKICYVGQLRQMHQKLELHSDDGDMQIISQKPLEVKWTLVTYKCSYQMETAYFTLYPTIGENARPFVPRQSATGARKFLNSLKMNASWGNF